MNKEELLRLIEKGESEKVEFKETPKLDNEIGEVISAFSNTKGGKILIGVSDSGKIIGVTIGKNTIEELGNYIRRNTDPKIYPSIKVEEVEEKKIIKIEISESREKPVFFKNHAHKRVGRTSPEMSSSEIRKLAKETGEKIYWDGQVCKDASLEDIDEEKVKKYIELANKTGRRKIKENPLEVLKKLELIKSSKISNKFLASNRPTWACILLFGKEPQRFISQAKVHCGKFKDEITIINDELIKGTLTEQVERVMEFIKKNLSVKFVITGKPRREEIWEYPLEAVREAIVNAICHRDYTEPSDIQIRIYDDKLIVWSSGKLPSGITLEDLYKPHKSVLRNKLIAQVFFDIGFIESWGSGIHRMIQSCLKQGLPEPKFEEYQGFRVVFRKDVYTKDYLKSLDLNERQIKTVMFVKKEGKITNKKYQELFDVSRQTASRELSDLTKKGVFRQVGVTGKGTFYTLIQTPHKRLINASLNGSLKGSLNGSLKIQKGEKNE